VTGSGRGPAAEEKPGRGSWRDRAYEVVFESDTPAGRAFDVALIVLIVASVGVVMMESVAAARSRWGGALRTAEWAFTILFTVEYLVRLAVVRRPLRYARSFFGLIDLLSIVPTYLSVLLPGTQYLLVLRLLRILRVFRVLKLAHYLREAQVLGEALKASRRKILVFIFCVLTLDVVLGSLMYLVEGPANGFTSIPVAVYWTIVTLTTVGYGDISPQTPLGQAIASLVMIIGYGIIAVPTGIVTVELSRAGAPAAGVSGQVCPHCHAEGHAPDALFCRRCGGALNPES
jgi:voltage-gated potassium channel